MRTQLFYTRDTSALFTRLTLKTTGGAWAHVGIEQSCDDAEWDRLRWRMPSCTTAEITPDSAGRYSWYFESILRVDEVTGKTGVRGPLPFSRVHGWVAEAHATRAYALQRLPSWEDSERILAEAMQDRRRVSYPRRQLVQNWRYFALKRAVGPSGRSPNEWTCVEFALRKLAPATQIAIGVGEYLYDEFAPSAARGPGLFEAVARLTTPVPLRVG